MLLSLILLLPSISANLRTTFDFKNFTESPNFVDKTDLLQQLFLRRTGEHTFVTFPPKFGKSTNLLMLKKLLQFELDHNYQPKPLSRTGMHYMIPKLKIDNYPQTVSAHVAQHPVILLDLKFYVEGEITEDKLLNGVASKVRECYQDYEWLLHRANSSNANIFVDDQLTFFEKALKGELSENQLQQSLYILSEIIFRYFNESKVILLVDDFDYVSKHDFSGPPNITDNVFQTMVSIIVNVIKSKYCMKNSLILSTSDRKVVAPLYGAIRQYSFLEEHQFTPFFGISSNELEQLFKKHNCDETERTNVKTWYAAYETNQLYRQLHNPYSITEYFRHRSEPNAVRPYWAAVQDTTFIPQFLRVSYVRSLLIELLQYRVVCCIFRKRRLLSGKKFLPNVTSDSGDIRLPNHKRSDLVGLMFEHGYLSHASSIKEGGQKIPNLEIENLLISILLQFYQNRSIPIDSLASSLQRQLEQDGNDTEAGISFQQELIPVIESINKADFQSSPGHEYHAVFFVALLRLKSSSPDVEIIIRERPSAAQYDDILLLHKPRALFINVAPAPRTDTHSNEYLCRSIRRRGVTSLKFLSVSVNPPADVDCIIQQVQCDSSV